MAASLFTPPPPQSMSGYFTEITDRRLKNFTNIYQLDFNGALRAVRQRNNPSERLALLAEFSNQMEAIGRGAGFLGSMPKDADPSHSIAQFIIEEGLGLKGKSVDKKVYDKGLSLTKEWVKSGLNSTGKSGFRLLEVIWSIVKADSFAEVIKILTKEGSKDLIDWLKANSEVIIKMGLRKAGYNSRARYQIMRVIASRIALLKAPLAFLSRIQPYLFALDLLLTPSETVSSFEEQRSMFLLYYSQIQTDQTSTFATLTSGHSGASPGQLAMPFESILRTSISSARD